MQAASKSKIGELQAIMTKMPFKVCCVYALPEFGVRWSEVSRAVRNARLPMTSASVARIICRHVAKSLPADDVEDIIATLQLKLVATQTRTWHALRLLHRDGLEPAAVLARRLPGRLRSALSEGRARNMRAEVQTAMMGDLIYVSVRLVSATREGSVLYLAVPPGQDALLTSSLSGTTLLKAAVQALGYKEYQNMNLHGHDIDSLLRISDPAWNGPADHLSAPPDYAPAPVVTPNGIDYTNKTYDERYVDQIIGPQPPLLTDITITATKSFFDPSRLNKQMNLTVRLKSDDVAKSLKSWVSRGALAPTSDFFQIYHKIKSNKITYTQDSD
ncbi:uncharacterized protein LOC135085492 isoform X2 [Ostrinia nubilalis]|uniref:uncharacterized protein LOC135085492 isoform X2 n=1 Tax=Ostrinia nubilalis TaxID=29057 RepID=UPI00308222D1